jgi:hypothetical protein
MLRLTHEYINQDQLYLGSKKSFVGAIPEEHDEVQTINERNDFMLQLGVTDALGLSVNLPFVNRQHSHIGHESGTDVYETWNFSALGDMKLSAFYSVLHPASEFEPRLDIIGGVKLPSGVTGMKNAEGEEAEVTIQPGTGSTDGYVALNYHQAIGTVPTIDGSYGAMPLILGASFTFNGSGSYGYRFGNSMLAHIGTEYRVAKAGSILLQVNGKFQDYADVGKTAEPRENTGGTWVFASPGLNLELNDALRGAIYVQIPVYQNVHGLQQTAKYNLSFDLSYTLNLLGKE